MNRRLTVALVAAASVAVLAPAANAAAKKDEIRISGGTVFKAGKYMKDEVHFNANTTVASGGTIKVVNKGSAAAGPHTVTLLKRSAMPKTLKQAEACFQFKGACAPLMDAHKLDPETMEPSVPVYDAGAEGFDEGLLEPGPEQDLYNEFQRVRNVARASEYLPALEAIASIRPKVDLFFDKVLVNAPDAHVRRNRLTLLHNLRGLGFPILIDNVQFSPAQNRPGQVKLNLTLIILNYQQWKADPNA